jgi:4-hydroxy-3-polyprenylbenzoate decarboxylase
MARIVVGISGASGVILAKRMLVALGERGFEIELVMSTHALYTTSLELGKEFASPQKFIKELPNEVQERITIHPIHDSGSSICSGSYKTLGMMIIPCSMATLGAVACGLSDNTLKRAADVTIKERRKLVIVPRETPLSEIHLENMLKLSRLGAVILPPIPAWYNEPKSLEDMENFIVGRVLDQFGVEHSLYKEWK